MTPPCYAKKKEWVVTVEIVCTESGETSDEKD